ncbi:MAG TPA: hypothetical protein VHQ90_10175 [Thermoanaerobaculia bacterium]|nr:hypothetical protein [Thermoanaerobaculia bacterium]
MSSRAVAELARADFRERARRSSFLLTLAATLYFCYLINAGYVHLSIAGQRGVLNSAWMGTLMGLFIGTLLPLAGFYLVKNTLEWDRRTGVGEILAATPLSRRAYTMGKALSNFLLLAVIVALLALAAAVLQLLAGEDRRLDLAALLAPIAWLALPPIALTAAAAVFFEAVSWLRGTLGNVLYFFLWTAAISASILVPAGDLVGIGAVHASLERYLGPTADGKERGLSLNLGPGADIRAAFTWQGVAWTTGLAARRLTWLAAAAALALLAALPFSRFDPARERPRGERSPPSTPGLAPAAPRRRRVHVRRSILTRWVPAQRSILARRVAARQSILALWVPAQRSILARRVAARRLGGGAAVLVAAEVRLMVKGRSRWWFAGAAALVVAGLAVPAGEARGTLLALAWIWPLPLFSAMGTRETRHGTRELIVAGASSPWRHAAAIWAAGVLVAAAAGAGVALRLAFASDAAGLTGWLAGCLFVPSLALALGAASGSPRLFEIVYLLLWYCGPMNRVALLDFTCLSAPRPAVHPLLYLALAAALLAVASLIRRRQTYT